MEIDLTKIDQPFGKLDQQTQWMLRGAHEAGEEIEIHASLGEPRFATVVNPEFCDDLTYRLKPRPVKHTATWDMGVAAFDGHAPVISHSNLDGNFVPGKATVEMIDGKATRIVWEAS